MEFDNDEHNINKFDISEIKEGDNILIFGQRGAGKSELCKNIIHHFKYFPSVQIISPTERLNNFYSNFITNQSINLECTESLINEYINCQRTNNGDVKSIFVMDDCVNRKSFKIKNLREILCKGVYYGITYLLTTQHLQDLSSDICKHFDYIFLFKNDYINTLKTIYNRHISHITSFKIFKEIFKELTKNFGCMVISNKNLSKDINKRIFHYEGKINNEYFLMGISPINKLKNNNGPSSNNLLERKNKLEITNIVDDKNSDDESDDDFDDKSNDDVSIDDSDNKSDDDSDIDKYNDNKSDDDKDKKIVRTKRDFEILAYRFVIMIGFFIYMYKIF